MVAATSNRIRRASTARRTDDGPDPTSGNGALISSSPSPPSPDTRPGPRRAPAPADLPGHAPTAHRPTRTGCACLPARRPPNHNHVDRPGGWTSSAVTSPANPPDPPDSSARPATPAAPARAPDLTAHARTGPTPRRWSPSPYPQQYIES